MTYKIHQLVLTDLQVNCYILGNADGDALCIDPGGEPERILELLDQEHLALRLIINTHGHFDHILGNHSLKAATGADIAVHSGDAALLQSDVLCGAALFGHEYVPEAPDILLEDGQTTGFGDMSFEVLHTPGHTPGSCSLLDRANLNLFCGDFVFQGGVGRWDFPGGNRQTMLESLRTRFLPLDDGITLFPGHGPLSSVGREKADNPYITALA